jgi:hypothetical protein
MRITLKLILGRQVVRMELAKDRAQRYHSINDWDTRGRKCLLKVL